MHFFSETSQFDFFLNLQAAILLNVISILLAFQMQHLGIEVLRMWRHTFRRILAGYLGLAERRLDYHLVMAHPLVMKRIPSHWTPSFRSIKLFRHFSVVLWRLGRSFCEVIFYFTHIKNLTFLPEQVSLLLLCQGTVNRASW